MLREALNGVTLAHEKLRTKEKLVELAITGYRDKRIEAINKIWDGKAAIDESLLKSLKEAAEAAPAAPQDTDLKGESSCE